MSSLVKVICLCLIITNLTVTQEYYAFLPVRHNDFTLRSALITARVSKSSKKPGWLSRFNRTRLFKCITVTSMAGQLLALGSHAKSVFEDKKVLIAYIDSVVRDGAPAGWMPKTGFIDLTPYAFSTIETEKKDFTEEELSIWDKCRGLLSTITNMKLEYRNRTDAEVEIEETIKGNSNNLTPRIKLAIAYDILNILMDEQLDFTMIKPFERTQYDLELVQILRIILEDQNIPQEDRVKFIDEIFKDIDNKALPPEIRANLVAIFCLYYPHWCLDFSTLPIEEVKNIFGRTWEIAHNKENHLLIREVSLIVLSSIAFFSDIHYELQAFVMPKCIEAFDDETLPIAVRSKFAIVIAVMLKTPCELAEKIAETSLLFLQDMALEDNTRENFGLALAELINNRSIPFDSIRSIIEVFNQLLFSKETSDELKDSVLEGVSMIKNDKEGIINELKFAIHIGILTDQNMNIDLKKSSKYYMDHAFSDQVISVASKINAIEKMIQITLDIEKSREIKDLIFSTFTKLIKADIPIEIKGLIFGKFEEYSSIALDNRIPFKDKESIISWFFDLSNNFSFSKDEITKKIETFTRTTLTKYLHDNALIILKTSSDLKILNRLVETDTFFSEFKLTGNEEFYDVILEIVGNKGGYPILQFKEEEVFRKKEVNEFRRRCAYSLVFSGFFDSDKMIDNLLAIIEQESSPLKEDIMYPLLRHWILDGEKIDKEKFSKKKIREVVIKLYTLLAGRGIEVKVRIECFSMLNLIASEFWSGTGRSELEFQNQILPAVKLIIEKIDALNLIFHTDIYNWDRIAESINLLPDSVDSINELRLDIVSKAFSFVQDKNIKPEFKARAAKIIPFCLSKKTEDLILEYTISILKQSSDFQTLQLVSRGIVNSIIKEETSYSLFPEAKYKIVECILGALAKSEGYSFLILAQDEKMQLNNLFVENLMFLLEKDNGRGLNIDNIMIRLIDIIEKEKSMDVKLHIMSVVVNRLKYILSVSKDIGERISTQFLDNIKLTTDINILGQLMDSLNVLLDNPNILSFAQRQKIIDFYGQIITGELELKSLGELDREGEFIKDNVLCGVATKIISNILNFNIGREKFAPLLDYALTHASKVTEYLKFAVVKNEGRFREIYSTDKEAIKKIEKLIARLGSTSPDYEFIGREVPALHIIQEIPLSKNIYLYEWYRRQYRSFGYKEKKILLELNGKKYEAYVYERKYDGKAGVFYAKAVLPVPPEKGWSRDDFGNILIGLRLAGFKKFMYSGHAGYISIPEDLQLLSQDPVGIDLSCCDSRGRYAATFDKLFPSKQFIGTKDRASVCDTLRMFDLEMLNIADGGDYNGLTGLLKQHKDRFDTPIEVFVIPDDKGIKDMLGYKDLDGDGIPLVYDNSFEVYRRYIPAIDDFNYRYSTEIPQRNLMPILSWVISRFSVDNHFMAWVSEELNFPDQPSRTGWPRGWHYNYSSEEEAFFKADGFTVEINSGFQFCSVDILQMKMSFELRRFYEMNYELKQDPHNPNAKTSVKRDGKIELSLERAAYIFLRSLEPIALGGEEIRSQNEERWRSLYQSFVDFYVEKGLLPAQISSIDYDTAFKAYWAKEYGGHDAILQNELALIKIKRLFGVPEDALLKAWYFQNDMRQTQPQNYYIDINGGRIGFSKFMEELKRYISETRGVEESNETETNESMGMIPQSWDGFQLADESGLNMKKNIVPSGNVELDIPEQKVVVKYLLMVKYDILGAGQNLLKNITEILQHSVDVESSMDLREDPNRAFAYDAFEYIIENIQQGEEDYIKNSILGLLSDSRVGERDKYHIIDILGTSNSYRRSSFSNPLIRQMLVEASSYSNLDEGIRGEIDTYIRLGDEEFNDPLGAEINRDIREDVFMVNSGV